MTSSIARVRNLVAVAVGIDRRKIRVTTDLSRDLGADSLDKVGIAMQVEDAFGIEISDAEVHTMRTVEDVVRLVEEGTNAC